MKLALGLAAIVAASAQEATVVAPDAYKLVLENDWVRVLRVHYAAHGKIPLHRHPATPSVFVYLDDAGPVRFSHEGDHPFTAVRPPVKAGGMRVTSGVEEVHVVESLSETPDDSLRIEMKTQNPGSAVYNRRVPPEIPAPAEPYTKIRFENAQVRITQSACKPHTDCGDSSVAGWPDLIVSFGRSKLMLGDREKTKPTVLSDGAVFWRGVGSGKAVQNDGEKTARFISIALKTPLTPSK